MQVMARFQPWFKAEKNNWDMLLYSCQEENKSHAGVFCFGELSVALWEHSRLLSVLHRYVSIHLSVLEQSHSAFSCSKRGCN